MKYGISHDFKDESLEAKAEWFLLKSLPERLREALEGIVLVNKLQKFELPDDRSTFKSFQILEPRKR